MELKWVIFFFQNNIQNITKNQKEIHICLHGNYEIKNHKIWFKYALSYGD